MLFEMKLFCQGMVILNNPIMNQNNPSCTVWMGIDIRDPAMSGPAGMSNTAVGRCVNLLSAMFPEIFDLSRLFDHADPGIFHAQSDTSAVISAVFQTGQPF